MYRVTSLGLNIRLERMLAYALLWVSGAFLFFIEKNRSVRFHAVQAMITFAPLSVLFFVAGMMKQMLSYIPLLNIVTNFGLGLLQNILGWVMVLLWVWLMFMAGIQSEKGTDYHLPFVGDLASRFV